ncbi:MULTISPECIES: hypothetical protein [Commensalibacter]|uniref:hypothetical protein n=1 Tax=Commensalibacter TaxID=1079922 RepID=UPI0012D864A3|nr:MULTISPECIES: hypothetical protein [Commensalibacter]MBH9973038.1 hypothetical protein [Commensalibacter melissae]MBI0049616.1 hypothetical protein [Commensalibacter sp. B14384M3]MBI0082490.1 hypothetical protein [Commensalibacter sp. W6292M3]MBI0087618.1 hypothetical protein [Commensalibacter melissae]MBI0179663.1 hypothetical protein [Commensalibacter sp. W8163]
MTIVVWILAIGSIILWSYNFTYLKHREIYEWFDNKFGKDDPIPPMPSKSNSDQSSDDKKNNL